MKTYYIYNQYTDEYIGKMEAHDILYAELKAYDVFGVGGEDVYALTTAPTQVLV